MTSTLRNVQRLVLLFVIAALIAAGLLHTSTPRQHETVAPAGCWFEKVSTDPELICGDPTLRPADDTADSLR